MRRNKSIVGDRRPQSDRKRLQEKFSNRINIFRVHSSPGKRSYNPNHNHNNNCGNINDVDTPNSFQYVDNTMPLQQDNLYQQPHNSQDDLQLILDNILALTPATAFVPMPNNDSTGIAHQTVPTFYPINTINSLQDQTAIGIDHNNIQAQNGYTTFNQTVPGNLQQQPQQRQQHQHHHHHGNPHHPPTHYYSEFSFFTQSTPLDAFGNQPLIHTPIASTAADNNSQSPPPPPPVDTTTITLPNTIPPPNQNFRNSYEMPTRPNPPSFPHGPKYFQASESFRSYFSQVDADDSGFITLEELRTFLQNKDKTNFNDDAVLTIMDMFDNNKDNMIDSSEFPDMLAFIKNWKSCFVYLDADKSGTIDYREMSLAIESLGFAHLSHRFILRLLKKYDRANNGQIDFDNFILACVTLCRCKETYEFMEKKFGCTGPAVDLEQFISSIIWPATNQ